MPVPTWTDQSGATPGTALSAVNLLATAVVKQIVTYQPTTDLTTDSSHQGVPSATYGNWGHLHDIALTTAAGSSVLALAVGTPWNYSGGGGNWWMAALALDGATVQATAGQVTTATASAAYTTPSVSLGVWTGLSAGAHTVNVLGSSGGAGGLNPAGGYKKPDGSSGSGLTVVVIEFTP